MKYQAFISYKHSEVSRKQAVALEKALKKYAKPLLKPHIKIFRDEKEMRPGDDLGATIENALRNSEYFIYMASKEAAESQWVKKEILTWCKDLKQTDKLIIIQIGDEILTDAETGSIVWEKTDALPSLLKDYMASIPVYIDLKWAIKDESLELDNIRFKEIINTITARFHDKTPAEMNDEQVLIDRRNNRIKNWTIGIFFVLFVSLFVTTWTALIQKRRADKQFKEAVLQKNRADELFKEAVAQKNRAEKQYKEAVVQKKRADELSKEAIAQKNRAERQYKAAIISRLASESILVLPTDNIKAIRMAEAAYKISFPNPPPSVLKAVSTAAYSIFERYFDIESLEHKDVVNSVAFSLDGTKILTASSDNTAKLWNLQGELLANLNQSTGGINSAVFSPDGNKILTSSGYIIGNSPSNINTFPRLLFDSNFIPPLRGFTMSNNTTAKIWDLKGKLLTELNQHKGPVMNAVFSPDGTKILTASFDTTAKIWDLKGNLLDDLTKHTSGVNSAVFSPDGRKILTASNDNTVKIWNLRGKLLLDLSHHTDSVNSAVFSPDGNKILTASSDNTAKIWNLRGKLLVDLSHHTDNVNSAVFSPDGSKILTASNDKTVKIWDLRGNLLADWTLHISGVNSAVFSPDGTRILTASDDGTAKIWYTPEGIMEWLKTAPILRLTKEDKEKLGIADFEID